MADEVIRRDVVELEFEVKTDPLEKVNKELDKIKAILAKAFGKDSFEDFGDSAEDAGKSVDKIGDGLKKIKTNPLKKLKDHLNDTNTKAGKAFASLKNMAGVSFNKLKSGLKGVGSSLVNITKRTAKFAAVGIGSAAAGVGALVKQSVTAFGELEQLEGGVKKIFDEANVTQIMKDANGAYKDLGLSASQYLSAVNNVGATFAQTMGDQKGYDTARKGMLAVSDYASGTGKNINLLNEKYQMITRSAGSYQSIADQFSGLLPQTSADFLKQAKSAGLLTKNYSKLTDVPIAEYQQAVTSMLEIGVKNMGLTSNTLAEAEGTFTGSLGMFKSAWGNLMPAFIQGGDVLDQAMQNVVDSASSFGTQLIPKIGTALGGITQFIEKISPQIEKAIPKLVKDLLPPLITAATVLFAGVIKALPSILGALVKEIPNVIKILADAVTDTFGKQFPILQKIGDFFKEHAQTIGNNAKKITLAVVGVIGAFKLFKGVSFITSLFGKKTKGRKGGFFDGITKSLTKLGKTKTGIIAKGMLNLGIIVGGFAILTAACAGIFMLMSKYSDATTILKMVAVMGALGVVGGILSKVTGIIGNIPIMTTLKGLANIGLVVAGMSALYLLIGAVSLINFDVNKIMQITKIIGVLGTLGAVLAGFAGLVGLIPIPIVLQGLANIGLVIGGMTVLIAAYAGLSKIKGFDEFISSGGETLANIMSQIGKIGGSLVSGFGEGLSRSLPTIGENIGQFGKNIKPLFDNIKGVDMKGVGAFFAALVGLLGVATGSDIINGIKKFFGGGEGESPIAKLGTQLSAFAENSKGFFDVVASIKKEAFSKGKQAINMVKSLCNIESLKKDNLNLATVGNQLSSFAASGKTAFEAFANYPEAGFEKATQIANSVQGLGNLTFNTANIDAFVDALNTAQGKMDKLVKNVSKLPKKMGDGIKSSGQSLSEALVKIWQDAVKASAIPVNKVIAGANWILKEFGSQKRVAAWTPYAKGTHGHKGGNALVNDGRGAELVQMPNGQSFIPQGKNVFIPNAPKGMKVMPAEQTAKAMGRNKPTFNYAKGIGSFDIWDYQDKPSGLISALKNNFADYNGVVGLAKNISQGMVNTITGQMTNWAKKLYDEFGVGKGWKFPSAFRNITSYFGRRSRPTKGASTNHGGIDIGAPYGTPVFASKGGKVSIAGWSGGYGNLVEINHGQGWTSRYGHNSSLLVSAGQRVRQGQTIALVGSTGVSTGAHIHFEIRKNGAAMNPMQFLGKGFANGGIATKPSIFGEDGAEMAIPLSQKRRKRAISLWKKTGRMLGYTPENSVRGGYSSGDTENNTYAPVFNFHVHGSVDDKTTVRKLKKVVREAMNEVFEGMERKNHSLQMS